MWERMLAQFRRKPTVDETKAAALRETERMTMELRRLGITVELATHRTIDELERDLRQSFYEAETSDRT